MALLYALGLGGVSPLSESVGVALPREHISVADQEFKRTGLKRVSSLKLLPSRVLSRAYGAVSHLPLPVAARPLVYGLWSWLFKVKLDEADCASLTDFVHLTEFFTRSLRPGARRVDDRPHVVASPVDGTVVSLSCDVASRGVLRQVKGIDYHVCDFLGLDAPPPTQGTGGRGADPVVGKQGTALFSAVLYLAPGDYHKFHSPTEWSAERRAHIAGQLLPVNPVVVQVVPSLFCANERVALIGAWAPARPHPHASPQCEVVAQAAAEGAVVGSPVNFLDRGLGEGSGGEEEGEAPAGRPRAPPMLRTRKPLFFSYTAVGATNVGSIRINCEPELVTNTYKHDWACGFSPGDAAAALYYATPDAGKGAPGAGGSLVEPPVGSGVSGQPARGVFSGHQGGGGGGAEAARGFPTAHSSLSRQKHTRAYAAPVPFVRGDEVGVFELGSTVVLVFEAPVDFKWTLREGDKIKMGQALGHLPPLKCKCGACAVATDDSFSPASPPPTHFRGRASEASPSRASRPLSSRSTGGAGGEEDTESGSSTDADTEGSTDALYDRHDLRG